MRVSSRVPILLTLHIAMLLLITARVITMRVTMRALLASWCVVQPLGLHHPGRAPLFDHRSIMVASGRTLNRFSIQLERR